MQSVHRMLGEIRRMDILLELGLVPATPTTRFDWVTSLLLDQLECDTVRFSVMDPTSEIVLSSASSQAPSSAAPALLADSLSTQVVQLGSILVIEDAAASPYAEHPDVVLHGTTAFLGAPVRLADGCTIGTIAAAHRGERRAWSAHDRALLLEFAAVLSNALDVQLLQTEAVAARTVQRQLVDALPHELRTPLSSILGYLELVTDGTMGPLNAQQRNALAVIDRNARRMQAMAENFLVLQSSKMRSEVVHVREVLHSVLVQHVDIATRIRWYSDHESDLVQGHAHNIARAFDCMLDNAIRHTPEDTLIHISLTTQDGWVRIAIRDDGPGLSEADRNAVLRPFSRADEAVVEHRVGIGLGLSVAKAVCQRHGGRLAIESQPGMGTTVTMQLPHVSALEDEPASAPVLTTVDG